MYIYYLQQIQLANSTRSVAMSALKWVVEHGQFFEYDGFPEGQIFDGDEYQALKQDDVLRTRYIPDNVMEQIEIALKKEKNILLKSIVEIGIDSGIRLSEVLDLTEGCITEDFTGKPVLYVFSPKNKADRYIPVSNRVKRAVQLLEQYSEVARKELATNYICLYWQKRNIRYARLLQAEQVNIDKISDEQLIDQILRKAVSDLDRDENILVAASVVVGLQLGLRISEIITMYNASIEPIGGETKLVYNTGKLQAEPTRVYKPANALVVQAITKVEKYTDPLRKESGLAYLFLNRIRNVKGYPVCIVSHANWSKNFLRPWLQKHNLRYKNGDIADFSSHTFRHACATYALKGGASLETIRELLNHKSIRGTQQYTHLLQEDVRNKFSKVFNEGAVLVGKQALQIKEKLKVNNPFKGKTIEQVDKLRKAHKIQILSHGLCLHHPMRNEPCEGDGVCLGCNNFLTTPDFLEVHKGRLKKNRSELASAPAGGLYENKLKTIEKYLVGIIDELETQVNYSGIDNHSDYNITPSEWEGMA